MNIPFRFARWIKLWADGVELEYRYTGERGNRYKWQSVTKEFVWDGVEKNHLKYEFRQRPTYVTKASAIAALNIAQSTSSNVHRSSAFEELEQYLSQQPD